MTTIPATGDRIWLVTMEDDPDPIPVGEIGTGLRFPVTAKFQTRGSKSTSAGILVARWC